ncbi:MAG TPA: Ig domain-containing protein [Acidimicrobiales bacterium]|nr:Ig domain-containing protein [Acidimicrobiales bacterium]
MSGVGLVTQSPAAAAGSTYYVSSGGTGSCTSNSASNGLATIASALSCSASGDTISVGPGTFAGGFTISDDVVLRGAGPATVITGPFTTGLNEITVADATTVSIEDLAVDGGLGQAGGTTANGGILAGSGALTLADVSVTDAENLNTGDGGPNYGAVADLPPSGTAADLTVLDSTLAGNAAATTDRGAALDLGSSTATPASSATVVNSTLTGNAGESVGAVSADYFGLTVRDSTISGNSGSIGGSGGIELLGTSTLTMADSILASNNVSQGGVTPDCRSAGTPGFLIDDGHNLVGIDTTVGTIASYGCGFVNGTDGDLVGTATGPIDPMLGALGHNGGPTETLALLSGSPAIGAGAAADCEASPVNDLDQRGDARNATVRGCDIGAYDSGGVIGAPLSVTTRSLPAGEVGRAYSATLAASGGTAPYHWARSGHLPAGLSLDRSTGIISGTPTTPGHSKLTIRLTDSATPKRHKAHAKFSIQVAPPPS